MDSCGCADQVKKSEEEEAVGRQAELVREIASTLLATTGTGITRTGTPVAGESASCTYSLSTHTRSSSRSCGKYAPEKTLDSQNQSPMVVRFAKKEAPAEPRTT